VTRRVLVRWPTCSGGPLARELRYRFLSLVIAIYLRLVLLYVYFSREIRVLKLIKVLLRKNGSIVYTASLLK
jgi:hypothetical protein